MSHTSTELVLRVPVRGLLVGVGLANEAGMAMRESIKTIEETLKNILFALFEVDFRKKKRAVYY